MKTALDSERRDRWRHGLRSLVRLNDGPWRWSVGLQVGLATGILLGAFTLAGHQQEGLTAILGAFAVLYFAGLRLVDRLVTLPIVAAGFVLASIIGVATSGDIWLTVAGLTIVAVIACLLSFGFSIGPPGAMMFVLVAGVSGHIAAPVSLGGADANPVRVILLVATGAFGSCLIIVSPLMLPFIRKRSGTPVPPGQLLAFSHFDHTSRIIISRILISTTIASLVSIPLGMPHAYWVIMTAGVLLQTGHTLRIPTIRAIQRIIGTILGVLVFGFLASTHPSGYWLVLVVAVLQGMVEVVIVRNYGLGLLFITPVALTISTTVSQAKPLRISEDRIVDTILGATIAMAVLFGTEWIRTHRRSDVTSPG